jgi:hypothetical protein
MPREILNHHPLHYVTLQFLTTNLRHDSKGHGSPLSSQQQASDAPIRANPKKSPLQAWSDQSFTHVIVTPTTSNGIRQTWNERTEHNTTVVVITPQVCQIYRYLVATNQISKILKLR